VYLRRVAYWDSSVKEFRTGSLSIKDGKIVGISAKASQIPEDVPYGKCNATIDHTRDLSGFFLLPAFIDSHAHLIGIGLNAVFPSLSGLKSILDVEALVRTVESPMVLLRGWDEELLGIFPDRQVLDRIDSERPVVLTRKCGHCACANSLAVDIFHLERWDGVDSTDISRGILKERALGAITEESVLTETLLSRVLTAASDLCLSYGVATIHTDDLGHVGYRVLRSLLQTHHGVRIYEKLLPSSESDFSEWMERPQDFFGNFGDHLCIRTVKLLLDGSLGARTAYLSAPYEGERDYRGVVYFTPEELDRIIRGCEKNGLSLCVHVIGDAALEMALKSFERCAPSDNPLRHRLIHLQMASRDQIRRIKRQNLWVSLQPIFYDSDVALAPKALGEQRYRALGYPFTALYEEGVPIALSTDAPVEKVNPWENIRSALRFFPVEEVFQMYTFRSAQSGFEEERTGNIRIGGYADALLFDKNPFALNQAELEKIRPVNVLFNGRWLYDTDTAYGGGLL